MRPVIIVEYLAKQKAAEADAAAENNVVAETEAIADVVTEEQSE